MLLRTMRLAGNVVLESGSVEVRAKAVDVEGSIIWEAVSVVLTDKIAVPMTSNVLTMVE